MLRFVALLLLAVPISQFAQTHSKRVAKKTAAKTTDTSQWPIETLSVEGNQNYSKEQILAASGLKLGQIASKSDFEAARDRLNATGLFETVGYRFTPAEDAKGYSASFQVVEVAPLYPMQFEGLPVKPAEINAWLKSKDPLYIAKLPGTKEVLARYTGLVQEFLASRNQTEKVAGRVVPTGPDQFAVMFRSAKPLPTIAQVKFTGNQVLSTAVLQNKISEVAIGFPYTDAGFRTLLEHAIRPLYEARGRVNVKFLKVATEKSPGIDGLLVTVALDEGPEYKLTEVGFSGKYAAKSTELLKIGKFKTGDVANFDQVQEGIDSIKNRLRRQGFLRADAAIERKIHDNAKTVDVVMRIEEGPQYNFGKLTVEGLDLNNEAGIRKLWSLKEGQPFDAEYPDYFLNRIRQENMFENLHSSKASNKVNEQAHLVDVTLEFR